MEILKDMIKNKNVDVGTVFLVGPSTMFWFCWRSSGVLVHAGDLVHGLKELRDEAKSLGLLQQLPGSDKPHTQKFQLVGSVESRAHTHAHTLTGWRSGRGSRSC